MFPEAAFLYTAEKPWPITGKNGIDIILRTRDRPLLLRRALKDIISQRYQDWHIQLVNDGGDRATLEHTLAEFADGLAGRVTVQHNSISVDRPAAINQGLDAAKTGLFVVHDDDDTWDPQFLSATVGLLAEPANAALIGAVTPYFRVNERIEGDQIVQESCYPVRLSDDFADLTRQLVLNRLVPIGVVFRTSLLNQIGRFNPDMLLGEDWEFSIRALLVGDVGVVPRPLAYHHVRAANTTGVYQNSINTDNGLCYKRYSMMARNSLIRRAVAAQPELLGLLQPLMHAIYDNIDAASRRMTHEHRAQSDQLHAVARMLTDQHADLAQRAHRQTQDQAEQIAQLEREIRALRQILQSVLSQLPQ